MTEILNELRICWDENRRAVIATIVNTAGSVYQSEGARCIIREDGTVQGVISGGCLEKDLFEYSKDVLTQGTPLIINYDFRSEDDRIWSLNLGCNGALKIWLQPFDRQRDPNAAYQMLTDFERRDTCQKSYKIGTLIEPEDLQRLGVGLTIDMPDEFPVGIHDSTVDNTDVQIFVEHVLPRDRVIIFGAGPDAPFSPACQVVRLARYNRGPS